jgi:hypothetical protein
MSAQTAMNDTNEEPACQRLLQRSGLWNLAVASFNPLLSVGVPGRQSHWFMMGLVDALRQKTFVARLPVCGLTR